MLYICFFACILSLISAICHSFLGAPLRYHCILYNKTIRSQVEPKYTQNWWKWLGITLWYSTNQTGDKKSTSSFFIKFESIFIKIQYYNSHSIYRHTKMLILQQFDMLLGAIKGFENGAKEFNVVYKFKWIPSRVLLVMSIISFIIEIIYIFIYGLQISITIY